MTVQPFKSTFAAMAGVFLCLMVMSFVQTATAADENLANSSATGVEFELAIMMEKEEFKTGEPIRFTVEGNQDYYLYIFVENTVSGKKTMLLPNIKQTYNAFPANTPFTVPDSTVSFSVDSAGTTVLTAVATRSFVPLNSTEWEIEGDFYTGNIGLFEEQLVGKGLVINDAVDGKVRRKTVFKQRELSITNAETKPLAVLPDVEDNPLVMVSSSCAVCSVGIPMKLGFSADRDGQLVLVQIDPDGNQITLLNEAVVANQIQYVIAVPEAPLGEHALVAVFGVDTDVSKTVRRVFKARNNAENTNDSVEKGLRLSEEPAVLLPHAIRQFVIVE